MAMAMAMALARAMAPAMANIILAWSLPTVTARQQPIARVLIEISAAPEEAGWDDAQQKLRMVDAAPGMHHYHDFERIMPTSVR